MYETKYDEILEDRRLYAYINDLQQELQRKDNNWNELKKIIIEYNNKGDYVASVLFEKIKELENDK